MSCSKKLLNIKYMKKRKQRNCFAKDTQSAISVCSNATLQSSGRYITYSSYHFRIVSNIRSNHSLRHIINLVFL